MCGLRLGQLSVTGQAESRGAGPAAASWSVGNVEEIREEWEALAESVGAAPWLRPGWFAAWWASFGSGKIRVLRLRRGARLVGVVPLRERLTGVGSLTNYHTPEFAPIAARGEELEVARALLRAGSGWVTLAFVDLARPELRAVADAASERGYWLLSRTLERSPYVATDGDWAEYESELSRKLRSELRRRRRLLAAEGRLSFEVEEGGERLDELLGEGFRVEAAGWKGLQGSAIATAAGTLHFYRAVARSAADRGWLRLGFLRLDGRPFAFDFALEHDGVHSLLKTGYDPAFSRFAPGMLLRHEMLERCFSNEVRRYDFLGEDEPWKLAWTRTVRERALLEAFAPSMRGRLAWGAFAYGRPLAKRLLTALGL